MTVYRGCDIPPDLLYDVGARRLDPADAGRVDHPRDDRRRPDAVGQGPPHPVQEAGPPSRRRPERRRRSRSAKWAGPVPDAGRRHDRRDERGHLRGRRPDRQSRSRTGRAGSADCSPTPGPRPTPASSPARKRSRDTRPGSTSSGSTASGAPTDGRAAWRSHDDRSGTDPAARPGPGRTDPVADDLPRGRLRARAGFARHDHARLAGRSVRQHRAPPGRGPRGRPRRTAPRTATR